MLCPECCEPMSDNGMCDECGCFFETPEFVVTDISNFNVRPQRAYHRLDHFKEVLGQFQGREGKEIPREIIREIRLRLLKKYDSIDAVSSDVTMEDLKNVMREMKLTKFMENFYYIMFVLTGKQLPYIKREIEDKIVRMFKMVDRVWCSIKKDNRNSFMNYYYILYKLLELMGQDELLPQVPLLKTLVRLRQHDIMWKRVCDELGWTWKQTSRAHIPPVAKPASNVKCVFLSE